MHYVGSTSFELCCEPQPSKSEYGIDIVTAQYRGAATMLRSFLQTLNQGRMIEGYPGVALQTYTVDTNPVYPTVSVTFKGLLNGLQQPIGYDETVFQSLTIFTETPERASREIQYEALATRWLYVERNRPVTGKITQTSKPLDPTIRQNVIKTEAGATYFGAAPAPLVVALTPPIGYRRLSFNATPVPGTQYFECEEVICRMFIQQGSTGQL